MSAHDETTVSLFPCENLAAVLEFYEALGFAITYRQEHPYLYAAVERGGVHLHFSHLGGYGEKKSFGAMLVFVSEVEGYHRAFADGLRTHYGRVPVKGLPRITRFRQGQSRFTVFDPSGNMLLFIERNEPERAEWKPEAAKEGLAQAMESAAFLRDTYVNDKAAGTVLDKALAQHTDATPIDRARALAMRAEIAIAQDDRERAESVRQELTALALSEKEREELSEELNAAERLEQWLTQTPS